MFSKNLCNSSLSVVTSKIALLKVLNKKETIRLFCFGKNIIFMQTKRKLHEKFVNYMFIYYNNILLLFNW